MEESISVLYEYGRLLVCVKPAGILSTDEPGGLPERLRAQQGLSELHTVHRLDRVVSGAMVLAKDKAAAAALSAAMEQDRFQKLYLAVLHGCPEEKAGELRDWLQRDKRECKTYVVEGASKYSREAVLRYRILEESNGLSLVSVRLLTGRTHQIRCQFSSRGLPLAGDRKYGPSPMACPLALRSFFLSFPHPESGETMQFTAPPEPAEPWIQFTMNSEILSAASLT